VQMLAQDAAVSRPAVTVEDIHRHYWPGGRNVSPRQQVNTLNPSEAHPDQLSFIAIFMDGHPRWESDGLIFTKTDLHLLPEYIDKVATRKAEMKLAKAMHAKHDESAEAMVEEVVKAQEAEDGIDVSDLGVTAVGTTMEGTHIDENSNPSVNSAADAEVLEGHDVSDSQKGRDHEHAHTRQDELQDIPPIDYAPGPHQPIPVFASRVRGKGPSFRFVSFFTITKIAILSPRSKELGRLIEMKWAPQSGQRSGYGGRGLARPKGSWLQDLSREWAVIKLQPLDPQADGYPEEPVIQKQPPRRREIKDDFDDEKDVEGRVEDERLAEPDAGPVEDETKDKAAEGAEPRVGT